MSVKTPCILYVDDELENLNSFRAAFRRDFTIHTASSAKEAMQILRTYNIHVIISDQRMPGVPGVLLLEDAVQKYPNQSRILISAYTDKAALDFAIQKCQIFDYVQKPWEYESLRDIITAAFKDSTSKSQFRKGLLDKEQKVLEIDEIIENIDDKTV
jgi:two-component system, sensor histidine kinase and response regulator